MNRRAPHGALGGVPARPGASRRMRHADERGTMTLELVILTPLLVAFLMLMVGLGRVVEANGQVDGAARDGARAASVSRSRSGAVAAAITAARRTLAGKCENGPHTSIDWAASRWRRGGQVTVRVRCTVDLAGLSLIGVAPSKTVTGTATAPLDTLRRVGR